MKKLFSLILMLALFTMLGQAVSASPSQSPDSWTSEKVRTPIEFIVNNDQDNFSTSSVIGGYLDFWVVTNFVTRSVTPHYEVGIDTPSDAFITGLDLNVYYSGNAVNGGDQYVPIFKVGLAHEEYTSHGNPFFYHLPGTYSATMSGVVSTNKGIAMTVSPATRNFKFTL